MQHSVTFERLHSISEIEKVEVFNPIQDGGGRAKKSPPPTSFYPVTSRKVGTSPQNFLTFSFILLATLV